jgi:hypothetical protein
MVAVLNNARVQIKVNYILISSRVPEKYTGEVMAIQFGAPVTRTFNTYSRTKSSKKFQIRFHTIIETEWSG